MIIKITEDTARLSILVRDTAHGRLAADWKNLVLIILPGQMDSNACGGGSPWYLHGCWPGKPTDVDIANPQPPDFPAMVIDAFEKNLDGGAVFILPDKFHMLPFGRYTGIVRRLPSRLLPVNLVVPVNPPAPPNRGIPSRYLDGYNECVMDFPKVPHPHITPPACCDLATFDIDYGPRCTEHMIDRVSVQFGYYDCDEDA